MQSCSSPQTIARLEENLPAKEKFIDMIRTCLERDKLQRCESKKILFMKCDKFAFLKCQHTIHKYSYLSYNIHTLSLPMY